MIKGNEWLVPDGVFVKGELRADCALLFEDGFLKEIRPKSTLAERSNVTSLNGIVTPGLIDLQVNGGGGTLFNADPTPDGIASIIEAHRKFGTSQILPTVISDTEEVLERACQAVIESWGMPGLAGIHIEGPHISEGKRGTHAAQVLRPLGDHTLGLIRKLRALSIPTLITVAPEIVPPNQIAQLVMLGAVVSLGHSDASYEQASAALAAGATSFTHLFNAMSQMTSRAPGMVGAALESAAFAGVICDGHHVSDAALSVAMSATGARDRMYLVSDAMPTVGGPDVFTIYGMEIHVREGKLVNSEGNLAGAHVTMAESIVRAVQKLGIPIADALQMGISTPAKVIGLNGPENLLGCAATDLLLWSDRLENCRWLGVQGEKLGV